MNPFRKLKAFLMLNQAEAQADAAFRQYGRRFFVMPTQDGKLFVMDRYDLRRMKVKHYISKNCHVDDLIRECFYFTPIKNGLGVINPQDRDNRRRAYYKWYDLTCKVNRIRKRKGSQPKA
jgi:hypothetical protein